MFLIGSPGQGGKQSTYRGSRGSSVTLVSSHLALPGDSIPPLTPFGEPSDVVKAPSPVYKLLEQTLMMVANDRSPRACAVIAELLIGHAFQEKR